PAAIWLLGAPTPPKALAALGLVARPGCAWATVDLEPGWRGASFAFARTAPISPKLRPSPQSVASSVVALCHLLIVTSTYPGSSSSPNPLRPTFSAARMVVPEPAN